jgi:hypothetical protein
MVGPPSLGLLCAHKILNPQLHVEQAIRRMTLSLGAAR